MWLFILVQKKKNLHEAKIKSFELMVLTQEISRQSSTDSVMWLLVASHMQIYNEKKQVE